MADDESITALLAGLSVPQKAALCLGSDFWHTAPVSELGIEAVMVSDGPHGLRKQTERSADAGLRASEPATCFPTASALGCSWDPDLARESTSSGTHCAGATSSTSPRTRTCPGGLPRRSSMGCSHSRSAGA
jgi:hypothetical protein